MSENMYLWVAMAVMTLITAATRFLPFVVFSRPGHGSGDCPGGEKKDTKYLDYLGDVLPPALMAMLVVYSLRQVNVASLEGWVPATLASALTLGVFWWRRNMLLAILGGTVVYMVLVQAVF